MRKTIETPGEKAYVLVSGGQDSFVSLLWALRHFEKVEALSLSYGQRHAEEIRFAEKICEKYQVPHSRYDLGDFLKSTTRSALLEKKSDISEGHPSSPGLPASFVPNRNGLFLTVAANHAFGKNYRPIHLVIGACETDYSGYPDCRDAYLKAKAVELSLGLDLPVFIHAPLMFKSKAETFLMAEDYGELETLLWETLTCYNGAHQKQVWGLGCGECPACKLRAKGWAEFQKIRKV